MAGTASKNTRTRWFSVSIDFYCNPQIIDSGVLGEVAFIRLLALARDYVATAGVAGSVPLMRAKRELLDIAFAFNVSVDEVLAVLISNRLITVEADEVVIQDYSEWQTAREEREDSRARERAEKARQRDTAADFAITGKW